MGSEPVWPPTAFTTGTITSEGCFMTMVMLMIGMKTITHHTMKRMNVWMDVLQTLIVNGVSVNAMLISPKVGASAVAQPRQQ